MHAHTHTHTRARADKQLHDWSQSLTAVPSSSPVYKISYDLAYNYRKFIINEISQEYHKLNHEHYLRQYYDFARESYL